MSIRPDTSKEPGAAARTAKNEIAAPGLTTKPTNDSKDRNSMVSAARARLGATAARVAASVTDDYVIYTPQQLNELITTVVAGRLRQQAALHEHAAGSHDRGPQADWHGLEADRLNALAEVELCGLPGGERR